MKSKTSSRVIETLLILLVGIITWVMLTYSNINKWVIWSLAELFMIGYVIKYKSYKGVSTILLFMVFGLLMATIIWLVPLKILPEWWLFVIWGIAIVISFWDNRS